jgi:hypothetical protein
LWPVQWQKKESWKWWLHKQLTVWPGLCRYSFGHLRSINTPPDEDGMTSSILLKISDKKILFPLAKENRIFNYPLAA